MTGLTLLQAAVDELYGCPITEFTTRRKALAAAARKSGDRESAALIAALRKPTLSADTLNRLVRAAPAEVGSLLQLGVELRAAESALNATELRELSAKRRRLVGDLSGLAFDITDQPSPSASVRDEVTATLNAALADERVADLLMSGSLVTRARWDGFGSATLPEAAAALPSPGPQPPGARPPREPSPRGGSDAVPGRSATVAAPRADRAGARRAAEAKATAARDAETRAEAARAAEAAATAATERAAAKSRIEAEQRRRSEAAQQEAAAAEQSARDAQEALSVIDRRISELSMQLAHQRELLGQAQKTLRTAETRRRTAQLALTRAGGPPRD